MKEYGFSKQERLCRRDDFQLLVSKGRSFYVYPFRCIYLRKEDAVFSARIAVSVSKKRFKRATDRNRIKRLIRESYRLEKQMLYDSYREKPQNLDMLIIYTDTKILPFSSFRKSMSKLIIRLIKENG
ncbi:MAG: ribonuclease P protein component [Bacteroidales bacterium]|jgi:ribonuclease P protein component|nr:ribonuclease P protein component [Bacteroidales bacterium]